MKRALIFFVLGVAIVAVIAAVVYQSTSTRVLYASQMGCKLDSDVYAGGGTDDSAALQAALNLATSKGYEFVLDGPALVSTNLVLASNTKLRILPGAGLFMKDHSDCWVLGNAQNTNYTSTNIWIEGGVINCNGNAQAEYTTNGHALSGAPGVWGVWFAGVDGLTMRDTKIVSSKAYALLFSDSRNGLFENLTFMWTNNPASTNTFYGTDCFHSQGNVTNVHVNGLLNIRGNDDTIALMTDETDQTLQVQDPRWTTNSGSMKNILIENVWLDKGADGIYPATISKLQTQGSTNAQIENLTIRNVYARNCRQGIVAISPGSIAFKCMNMRVEGIHVQLDAGFDQQLQSLLGFSIIQSDSLRISDIYVTDLKGAGIGTGGGMIGLSPLCTNTFVSDVFGWGSANNLAQGDPLITLADSVQNVPTVSMQNITAKRWGSLFAGGVTGIIKLSNCQATDGTILNGGISTNLFFLPTNQPLSGQVIGATGTSGASAWSTIGTPTTTVTNLISGQVYTNNSGKTEFVSCPVSVTTAAVVGAALVQLTVDTAGGINFGTFSESSIFGESTTVSTVVNVHYGTLTAYIPAGASYVITNMCSGTGNAVSLVGVKTLTQY